VGTVGSFGLTPWVAHPVFVALVVIGSISGEISRAGTALLVSLWLIGFIVFPRVLTMGDVWFPTVVAILDVILVFVVFKEDIRLS
jgi:hypothetical protein